MQNLRNLQALVSVVPPAPPRTIEEAIDRMQQEAAASRFAPGAKWTPPQAADTVGTGNVRFLKPVGGFAMPQRGFDGLSKDAAATSISRHNFQMYSIHADLPSKDQIDDRQDEGEQKTFKNALGTLLSDTLGRHQAGVKYWDDNQENAWFHYTIFPCIVNRREGRDVFITEVHPFAVFYANFRPGPQLVGHVSNWVTSTIASTGAKINIDDSIIADYNAAASITSAIVLGSPRNGTYIWFCDLAVGYQRDGIPPRIGGASVGLATTMAIMGAPSIAYTGYSKTVFLPDVAAVAGRNDHSYGNAVLIRSFPTDKQLEQFPELAGAGPRVSIAARPSDIVEGVSGLGYKVAWALAVNFPLVIPAKSAFGEDMQILLAAEKFQQQHFILQAAMRAYTTTLMDEGVSLASMNTPLLVASNVASAATLAAVAWIVRIASIPMAVRDLEELQGTFVREDEENKYMRKMRAIEGRINMERKAEHPDDYIAEVVAAAEKRYAKKDSLAKTKLSEKRPKADIAAKHAKAALAYKAKRKEFGRTKPSKARRAQWNVDNPKPRLLVKEGKAAKNIRFAVQQRGLVGPTRAANREVYKRYAARMAAKRRGPQPVKAPRTEMEREAAFFKADRKAVMKAAADMQALMAWKAANMRGDKRRGAPPPGPEMQEAFAAIDDASRALVEGTSTAAVIEGKMRNAIREVMDAEGKSPAEITQYLELKGLQRPRPPSAIPTEPTELPFDNEAALARVQRQLAERAEIDRTIDQYIADHTGGRALTARDLDDLAQQAQRRYEDLKDEIAGAEREGRSIVALDFERRKFKELTDRLEGLRETAQTREAEEMNVALTPQEPASTTQGPGNKKRGGRSVHRSESATPRGQSGGPRRGGSAARPQVS